MTGYKCTSSMTEVGKSARWFDEEEVVELISRLVILSAIILTQYSKHLILLLLPPPSLSLKRLPLNFIQHIIHSPSIL